MAASRVIINQPGMQKLLKSPAGPVARETIVVAEKVKEKAIEFCPKKTRNLSQHIVKRFRSHHGETQVLVGFENVPYGIWVHEGANPHTIVPKKGQYLVFQGRDGSTVFARSVNHPGNKPNRFLVRALDAVRSS